MYVTYVFSSPKAHALNATGNAPEAIFPQITVVESSQYSTSIVSKAANGAHRRIKSIQGWTNR